MKTSQITDVTNWFFETIKKLQSSQEVVTIGLPGGSSLDGWYEQLLDERYWIGDIGWKQIQLEKLRFCLVDERRVPPSSPDRNDTHVSEKLITPLCEKWVITEEQFIRPDENVDPLLYTASVWKIDIAVFGLGPDGHIASLFPHHDVLDVQVEWYILVHDAPKDPPERISITPITVEEISYTCLFAVWEQKKEALANFLDENTDYMDCPAKLLQPDIVYSNVGEY